MTDKLNIKFLAALLCDDVRTEDNGKAIIIGVYYGKIVVHKLPIDLRLTMWMNILLDGVGETEIEFRGFDPNNREAFRGKLKIQTSEMDATSITLPTFSLKLEKEGKLKIQYRKLRGRWTTLIDKDVIVLPPSEE